MIYCQMLWMPLIELCKQFNPKMAYTQSDEISLIFTNIDNINLI
jgi:tRNA(His) 5'-end guanylyltransferase